MALVLADRVRETTSTTGTGTLTLTGPFSGFRAFSAIGDGNTTYYAIADANTGEWEVGVGTYSTSGNTLSRDTVLDSSNTGSLVVFATGAKDVICTQPAERAVYLEAAGTSTIVPGITISGLTASTALALDASKDIVSVANTGTGSNVLNTSPTLVTPALGTPASGVMTNVTGTATALNIGGNAATATNASTVTTNADLTGAVTSVGNAASLGSFTSAQLATALTDETGTGANVFATSPTLVTPALGTPSSGEVTNLTGTASININGTVGATTPAAASVTVLTASADSAFTSTGAVQLSSGTTGQRPTGAAGKLRFNSTTTQFEGYNGANWASVGGDINASTVIYDPAGAGAVATTVQAKLRESVSVLDFGADATGATDSTVRIQAALDSGAKVVRAPAGTYKIALATLTIPDNVSLVGDGMGATLFDGSAAAFAALTSGVHIGTAGGVLTAIPALGANVAKGDRVITFASAPTLVPGDIIYIYNPTDYSFSGFRTYYRAGEMVRVASVSGTTVTLQSALCDSYVVTDVDLYRLDGATSVAMRGFTLVGRAGAGGTVTGLKLLHAIDSSVEDIRVRNCSYSQLTLKQAFNVQLRNVICEEDYVSEYGTDYGLVIANSQNIHVTGGYYGAARHGITTGGGTDVGDVSCRNVFISHATVTSTANAQSMDFHGNTEYAFIDNCVLDGGFAGGGDFIHITNNIFKGSYGNGNLPFYGSEFRGCNWKISGNTFWTNQLPTSVRGAFIDIGGNSLAITASTYKGGVLDISNNTCNWALTANQLQTPPFKVYNRGYTGAEPIEVHITDNIVSSILGFKGAACDISVAVTGSKPWEYISVTGNKFQGLGGVRVTNATANQYSAMRVTVQDNLVDGIFGIPVFVTDVQNHILIKGNYITNNLSYPLLASGQASYPCRNIGVYDNVILDNLINTSTSSITNISGVRVVDATYAVVQNNMFGSFNKYLPGTLPTTPSFSLNETVTGGTSGSTATVISLTGSSAGVSIGITASAGFTSGETITGGTSGATMVLTTTDLFTATIGDTYSLITKLQSGDNVDMRGLGSTRSVTAVDLLPGTITNALAIYNPESLADGAGVTTTVAVVGSKLGDYVVASFSLNLQGILLTAWVSDNGTVSVRFQNGSGGTVDLGSGTISVRCTSK